MSAPLLEAIRVGVTTPDGEPLASGISFSLHCGQYVLLQGENGSGKSTLIQALLGFHPLSEGTVRSSVAEDEIAFLPQLGNVRFFLPLTLADVMGLGQRDSQKWNWATELGLLDASSFDLAWNTASGGERQKALLTRALLASPKLLVLDEPFNHLDAASRAKLANVLATLLAQASFGLILISHEGALESRRPEHAIELKGRLA